MQHATPNTIDPKGDFTRRLSLGIGLDAFAAKAGITTQELREYELSDSTDACDPEVAARVWEALHELEAINTRNR